MRQKCITFLCTLLFLLGGYAQEDSIPVQDRGISDQLEEILEQWDGESQIPEEILEDILEEAPVTKINLNDLGYETAVKVLHLSDYQYYQLQLYIENSGALVSIYELSAIEGFTPTDVARLQPYVDALPVKIRSRIFRDFFKRSKSSLWVRYSRILERQAGYDASRNSHYAGSPGHVCFKYTFNSQDRVILRVAGEKDAGEQFFRGAQRKGFDLYSGSLCLQDIGILQRAVAGDFRLNFGQGLVAGSSLLSGKGGGVSSARRFATGIRPVAPTNEGDFWHGGAVTLGNHNIAGTLFAGRRFGKLQNCLGADFSYRRARFKIGARAIGFSLTDTSGTSPPERVRSSCTPTAFNVAADYHLILWRHLLFGEAACNERGKFALLQAAQLNLSPTLKLLLLFRHYDRDFSAPMGQGFAANSRHSGEDGLYVTADCILGRKAELNLYADYFRLTGPSYRTDAPINGMDFGLSLLFRPSRQSLLTLKYTWRTRPQNGGGEHLHAIADRQRHKVRLQWDIVPHAIVKLKTEIDWQIQHEEVDGKWHQGLLLFQDIAIEPPRTGLALHARVALFDTERYDERLYAYENDLYYAFTIGSYYYKGCKWYLLLRYKHKWFSIWVRVARTHYLDRQTISSGLNQIDKPHKTELKAQMMFSF